MMIRVALVLASLIAASPASAQHATAGGSHLEGEDHQRLAQHGGGHHGAGRAHGQGPATAQPYAGFEARDIKALSPQEVANLREGRGMGLALAAELNGWPGPMHVLELADRLGLTAEQRAMAERLMAAMRREAIARGEALISAERALDRAFRETSVSAERIETLTTAAAVAQARVRAAHLVTHLEMAAALTPDQIRLYNQARGYSR